jgi:putative hemolysin
MIRPALRRIAASSLLGFALIGSAAAAMPMRPTGSVAIPATDASKEVRLAQRGGCSSAAAQAAAQTGGQVLSVRMSQQGDRTVCVVTVLIPASDGNRPRRQTITIEQ